MKKIGFPEDHYTDVSINVHHNFPLGGGYVKLGDRKKGKETLIEAISFNKLAKGTKLLGIVREVNDDFCLISLPNLLTGYVLPKKIESIPLSQQLLVGQILAVHILKTSSDTAGKGKKQVTRRRIEVSVDPSDINASGELSRHEVLRGSITSIEDHGLIVNLGDGRKGFCNFSKVEGMYEVHCDDFHKKIYDDKRFLNEGRIYDFLMEDSADSNPSSIISLCLPSRKTLSEHVTPSTYHPTMQELLPGSLVNVKVDAVAKNGLLVSFAMFRGAITTSHFGANWIPSNKSGNIEQWKPIFDEAAHTLRARIITVDARTKVIRLSLQPHLLNLSQPMELPKPGTVIDNATVIRLDFSVGALLSLPPLGVPLPYLKAVQPNLAKNESYVEASRRPVAYVHISKTSSSRTDEDSFNKDFAPSTKHKLRILSTTNWVDGTATAATAMETMEAHVLQHQDLVPGKIYCNVPVCKRMDGGSVMVDFGLGVRGIISVLHLFDKSNISSDYRMRLRKEKYALERKVDVRVLTVDPANKRCFVTAKQSLVKANDTFTDYSNIEVGQRGTGFVSKIDEKSLYVTFFNKIYGRVTARSLAAELGVEDHQSDYSLGDIVKCRVISCRKRVEKNLDTYIDMDAQDVEYDMKKLGFWDLNLSLQVDRAGYHDEEVAIEKAKKMSKKIKLHSGAILPLKSMKIVELAPSIDKKRGAGFLPGHAIVRIKSKYIASAVDADTLPYVECKVPFDQVIDSYINENIETKEDMDDFGKKHFTIGKKINYKGIVLRDPQKCSYEYASAVGKLPIISLRPRLIETSEKQKENNEKKESILIPSGDTDLYMGALIQGYVHEVNPKHGSFIHFLDGVTGLIPKQRNGLLLSKWDTVTCKIEALDVTCKPPKMLIRKVSAEKLVLMPKNKDKKIAILPGDKFGKVKVLDVNFNRVKIGTLGSNIVTDYEVRARLHITMAEISTMEKVRSKPLPEEERGIEHISKGHPFYNWKTGKTLDNLVCVGSSVSQGILFVELSNRDEGDETFFFQTASELKPGTRVSCVIVGFVKSGGGILVQPSPGLTCFVPALELSEDPEVLNNLQHYFQAGDRMICTVLDKKAWEKKKNWGIKVSLPRTNEDNMSRVNDNPILSWLVALSDENSSSVIPKHTKGKVIVGRIKNSMRLYRPPSLMFELRGGYRGRCCITEIDEPDEWVNMPFGRQKKSTGDGDKPEGEEPSTYDSILETNKMERSSGYRDGEYIQCHVIEELASDPVVEVSLRKSRLQGNLEEDEAPEKNEVVNAYVINTTKKGCFLRLSRCVEGRVILKELADGFLPDPVVSFPMGRLVIGRVKAVKNRKLIGKNNILYNVDVDMRESQLLEEGKQLQFGDIKVDCKYKGVVTRIEDYGAFVTVVKSNISGLVHKSECSESNTKSVRELYDPGDLVKVIVIGKDDCNQKISFSMKANYFIGDESSDESCSKDSDTDSDVEMEEVENIQKAELQERVDSDDDNYISKSTCKVQRKKTSDKNDVGDDTDSCSDTDSDEEIKQNVRKISSNKNNRSNQKAMDTDVGFNWGATPVKHNKESDEDSESGSDIDSLDDEEEPGKISHSSRKKAAARRLEEQQISKREKAMADGTADENPETPADFERLLSSDPNNSEKWIRYMAYYLSLADIDGCRRVAKQAFDRIDFHQEGEKLNVWTALLTTELKYGVDFDETITEACKQNNSKQVYLRACELLEKEISCSENKKYAVERADKLYMKMCKKFRGKKSTWVAYLSYLLKQNRHQEAHSLLKKALLSLPSYKHTETMSKLAQLEFEFGSIERGRTIFDGILAKYPKRLDVLFVFVDKEIKTGEIAAARSQLQKSAEFRKKKLSDKQMKKLFRKWMKLEEEHGSEEQQEAVKDAARAYVERRS
mmetsp:Transcript_31818/g.36201  ORF Transcript_31818/g.36201 Transcript_31818/m.36201 type:complete len:1887 (+) Transcript_31818:1355-7015(+)